MESRRIVTSLLVLRVTVFLVMVVWTIDKFVRLTHAAPVYEHVYFLPGLDLTIIYSIGVVELAILIGFVTGFAPQGKWATASWHEGNKLCMLTLEGTGEHCRDICNGQCV